MLYNEDYKNLVNFYKPATPLTIFYSDIHQHTYKSSSSIQIYPPFLMWLKKVFNEQEFKSYGAVFWPICFIECK